MAFLWTLGPLIAVLSGRSSTELFVTAWQNGALTSSVLLNAANFAVMLLATGWDDHAEHVAMGRATLDRLTEDG